MKMVKVVWVDVRCTDRAWLSRDEIKAFHLPTVTALGYLLEENKDHVKVVPCLMEVCDKDDEYELFRPVWLIPSSQIIKITELTEKKVKN